MIATSDLLNSWLEHRIGKKRALPELGGYREKAFRLNDQSVEFIDTYGKKRIKSFVGFIDLAGFSS